MSLLSQAYSQLTKEKKAALGSSPTNEMDNNKTKLVNISDPQAVGAQPNCHQPARDGLTAEERALDDNEEHEGRPGANGTSQSYSSAQNKSTVGLRSSVSGKAQK